MNNHEHEYYAFAQRTHGYDQLDVAPMPSAIKSDSVARPSRPSLKFWRANNHAIQKIGVAKAIQTIIFKMLRSLF